MFEEDRGFSQDEMKPEENSEDDERYNSEDSGFLFDPTSSFTADLSNEGFTDEHVNGSPSSFFETDQSIEAVLDNSSFDGSLNDDNPSLNVVKENAEVNPYLNSSPSLDAFIEDSQDSVYSESYNPSMDVLKSAQNTTEPVPEANKTVYRKKGLAGKIDRFLSSTLQMTLDDKYNSGRSALILFIVGFFLVIFTRNSVKLEFTILGYVFVFVSFFKCMGKLGQKHFLVILTFIFSILFLIINLFFRIHVQDLIIDLFSPMKETSYVNLAQSYIDKAREKYTTGAIPSIYEYPEANYYLSEIYDESFEKYSPYGNLILLDDSYIHIEEDSSVSFNPVYVFSIYITDGEYQIGEVNNPLPAKKLRPEVIKKVKK